MNRFVVVHYGARYAVWDRRNSKMLGIFGWKRDARKQVRWLNKHPQDAAAPEGGAID